MSNKTFEKRKKIIYDFICDDMYVPMKFKEMAMVLQVNKEQRDELRQVLESLEEEGKICLSKRGKYCKVRRSVFRELTVRIREDLVLLSFLRRIRIFLSGRTMPAERWTVIR